MLSDIEIARKSKIQPIQKIAEKLLIGKEFLIPYGKYIAKVDLSLLDKTKNRSKGKYILVTAMTPTPLGEGKTVNTIGLGMSLNRLGKSASVCIRQPSMGPVFGIKGSAGGGGYSQILPREDFDLHFTGDAHAVGLSHNIAAAFLDNSLYRNNKLNIGLDKIYWRRVVDIGDRCLRNILIGLGPRKDGIRRKSGFDITASSEIMAILALSKDLNDLKKRLSRIALAETKDHKVITTKDIRVAGLMSVLLKDAIMPNLIQTIENTPCFVHTGPFANIAHGNSSIIQDEIALSLSDFVVTEAGFGADCGAEKFFDIKCRVSGFKPDAAVIVCSLRAIKAHGSMSAGLSNLAKQIENVKLFGIPAVVAINKFNSDSDKELDFVRRAAVELGADDCKISEVWQKGSKGGEDLAKSIIELTKRKSSFKFLYSESLPLKEKIRIIARRIYGAKDVHFSASAEKKLKTYGKRGWGKLAVCMAKTPLSLSHDPHLLGRPRNFLLPVRDVQIYAGAGFVSVLCGQIQTMPGLPAHPRGENIDINSKGNIIGLS